MLAQQQQLVAPPRLRAELLGVDLDNVGVEAIPGWGGLDGRRAERPAQPHRAARHHLAPGSRRLIAPQCLGEVLDRDNLADAHGEGGENMGLSVQAWRSTVPGSGLLRASSILTGAP